MEKADTVEHVEQQSSSDSEKAVRQPTFPVNEEDYEVTFKTWIVVTILASAYGVSPYHVPLNFVPDKRDRSLSGSFPPSQ